MKKLLQLCLFVAAISVFVTGCAPPKVADIVNVKPNETAWCIPLDGSSLDGQVKFNSVDYLEKNKVSTKRIMVDKVARQIGYGWQWWAIEWIPAVRVITVDRSLVSREWTGSTETGTSNTKQDIHVVTSDSVKIHMGLTITASIDESDASTYLYYHGETPLSVIMDSNIRSFAVAELSKEYSSRTLKQDQSDGNKIYQQLFDDAKKAFKEKGITIQYLGNSEGLGYDDDSIQKSINASYLAQQDNQTASMEQNAQKIRNETKILNAQADADAALKLYAAKDAAIFNNTLQVNLINANARATMATRWSGNLPTNILPDNSPMLLNLGTADAPTVIPTK